jgi:transcription antitermination factor NusG
MVSKPAPLKVGDKVLLIAGDYAGFSAEIKSFHQKPSADAVAMFDVIIRDLKHVDKVTLAAHHVRPVHEVKG